MSVSNFGGPGTENHGNRLPEPVLAVCHRRHHLHRLDPAGRRRASRSTEHHLGAADQVPIHHRRTRSGATGRRPALVGLRHRLDGRRPLHRTARERPDRRHTSLRIRLMSLVGRRGQCLRGALRPAARHGDPRRVVDRSGSGRCVRRAAGVRGVRRTGASDRRSDKGRCHPDSHPHLRRAGANGRATRRRPLENTYLECRAVALHGAMFNRSLIGIADGPLPVS